VQKHALTNDPRVSPTTFRATPLDTASTRPVVTYGRMVGGGTAHFTANYWRFHEIDFVEHSKKGPVAGADRDDWPITYAELEPYYTKVEWEIGVSGLAARAHSTLRAASRIPSAAADQAVRRPRRARRAQDGMDRVSRSDGDPLAAVSRPRRLRALRIL
jgi:choline dehydrogenase-like flavoprotein